MSSARVADRRKLAYRVIADGGARRSEVGKTGRRRGQARAVRREVGTFFHADAGAIEVGTLVCGAGVVKTIVKIRIAWRDIRVHCYLLR